MERGGALFIDYGEAHALEDSLRCFKGHEEVRTTAALVYCFSTVLYLVCIGYLTRK